MGNVERIETALPGVFELRPRVFRDARGFFVETYKARDYGDLGIPETFVQDNHSKSSKGVLRGLHYQLRTPQAKLCRVVEGEVLDIAVDIREGSPTFGKWTSVRLSAEMQNQIYVPIGFAHGFAALSDSVQFLYKCSDYYQAGDEFGVLWSDSDLKIDWGVDSPIISEKDAKLPRLADVPRENLPKYASR